MNALPDFTAELGADRNVLQVRVAAGKSSGRGPSLVELRVDPLCVRVEESWKRVHVSRFQFRQLAKIQNERRNGMFVFEALENVAVRRESRFRFLARRKFELFEEHVGKLFGARDVERPAGRRADFLFQFLEIFSERRALPREFVGVKTDTSQFHFSEDFDQRHIKFFRASFRGSPLSSMLR